MIEKDVRAFELSLAGASVRAVAAEITFKSTRTAWDAINRGREYVRERGIDIEERRFHIDGMFKRTLQIGMAHLEHQAEKGREKFTIDQYGNKSLERQPGPDPRLMAEMSRGSIRWAEFLGVMDRAPEVNAQTTLIQLAAPSDGAAFGEKWSQQAIEIEATGPNTGPTAQLPPAEASHALNEALLTKQFEPNQGAA